MTLDRYPYHGDDSIGDSGDDWSPWEEVEEDLPKVGAFSERQPYDDDVDFDDEDFDDDDLDDIDLDDDDLDIDDFEDADFGEEDDDR